MAKQKMKMPPMKEDGDDNDMDDPKTKRKKRTNMAFLKKMSHGTKGEKNC